MEINALEFKNLRERLGFSQDKMAKTLGVSRATIINYEKGGNIPESKKDILITLINKSINVEDSQVNEPNALYEKVKIIETQDKIIENLKEIIDHQYTLINSFKKK